MSGGRPDEDTEKKAGGLPDPDVSSTTLSPWQLEPNNARVLPVISTAPSASRIGWVAASSKEKPRTGGRGYR